MEFLVRAILLSVCGFVFCAARVPAAEKPFYEGKNLTFLINYAAGGPTDIEGRIVARHLRQTYTRTAHFGPAKHGRRRWGDRDELSRRDGEARRPDARVFYRSL